MCNKLIKLGLPTSEIDSYYEKNCGNVYSYFRRDCYRAIVEKTDAAIVLRCTIVIEDRTVSNGNQLAGLDKSTGVAAKLSQNNAFGADRTAGDVLQAPEQSNEAANLPKYTRAMANHDVERWNELCEVTK